MDKKELIEKETNKIRAEKIVRIQDAIKNFSEMKFYDKKTNFCKELVVFALEELLSSYLTYLQNRRDK